MKIGERPEQITVKGLDRALLEKCTRVLDTCEACGTTREVATFELTINGDLLVRSKFCKEHGSTFLYRVGGVHAELRMLKMSRPAPEE